MFTKLIELLNKTNKGIKEIYERNRSLYGDDSLRQFKTNQVEKYLLDISQMQGITSIQHLKNEIEKKIANNQLETEQEALRQGPGNNNYQTYFIENLTLVNQHLFNTLWQKYQLNDLEWLWEKDTLFIDFICGCFEYELLKFLESKDSTINFEEIFEKKDILEHYPIKDVLNQLKEKVGKIKDYLPNCFFNNRFWKTNERQLLKQNSLNEAWLELKKQITPENMDEIEVEIRTVTADLLARVAAIQNDSLLTQTKQYFGINDVKYISKILLNILHVAEEKLPLVEETLKLRRITI